MKLILYSNPTNEVLEKLEDEIFPSDFSVVFGYMPADGSDPKPEYTPFWQKLAEKHNAEFIYLDNSKKPSKEELINIIRINSLTITGGNTFALLHNIRNSGFDRIIKNLSKKKNFIYSGFSAGAIIATPNIRIADKNFNCSFGYDENRVGIKDTKALGFVDFEILPHYNPELDKQLVSKFDNKYGSKIKPLTDSEYIITVRK